MTALIRPTETPFGLFQNLGFVAVVFGSPVSGWLDTQRFGDCGIMNMFLFSHQDFAGDELVQLGRWCIGPIFFSSIIVAVIPNTITTAWIIVIAGVVIVAGVVIAGVAIVGGMIVAGMVVVGGTVIAGTAIVGGMIVAGTVIVGGMVIAGAAIVGGMIIAGTAVVGGTVVSGAAVVGGMVVSGMVIVAGTAIVAGMAIVAGVVIIASAVVITCVVIVAGAVAIAGVVIIASVVVASAIIITGATVITSMITVTGVITSVTGIIVIATIIVIAPDAIAASILIAMGGTLCILIAHCKMKTVECWLGCSVTSISVLYICRVTRNESVNVIDSICHPLVATVLASFGIKGAYDQALVCWKYLAPVYTGFGTPSFFELHICWNSILSLWSNMCMSISYGAVAQHFNIRTNTAANATSPG
jgi:hypothetical protein